MVEENDNKSSGSQDAPENSPSEETTADNAVERLYDEDEAWKKSKNFLFLGMGLIAATVGLVTYFDRKTDEEAGEQSNQYLEASRVEDSSEDRFLSLADENDEVLGGVARFRAAVAQYRAGDYDSAAVTFAKAAEEVGSSPPRSRALLGKGVSLIKAGKQGKGRQALQGLVDLNATQADAIEARYLLAVLALQEGDHEGFEVHEEALGSIEGGTGLVERLSRFRKTKAIVAKAKSLSQRNTERGKAYLEKNKAREGVKVLESGLQYEVLLEGNGSIPTDNDEVQVHYHGTLVDGEVFDSSVERGEPSSFGVSGVIKGWTEALKLMNVGSKWKLSIPPDIAYGENGSNSIGPEETLIFEVELLGITEKELDQPDSNATAVPDSNGTPVAEGNATQNVPPDVNASTPEESELNSTDN